MTTTELKALLINVKKRLRVTKVVATRAVKTRGGDSFAGFSAAWESVQDDAGSMGAELIDGGISTEESVSQGMTLTEARVAHYLLAMQADIAATEAATAAGNLKAERCLELCQMYRTNYSRLIQHATRHDADGDGK